MLPGLPCVFLIPQANGVLTPTLLLQLQLLALLPPQDGSWTLDEYSVSPHAFQSAGSKAVADAKVLFHDIPRAAPHALP